MNQPNQNAPSLPTGLAGCGQRERVTIAGENLYLLVVIDQGVPSLTATVPHENRADRAELRLIVETLCDRANAIIARLMVPSQTNEEKTP